MHGFDPNAEEERIESFDADLPKPIGRQIVPPPVLTSGRPESVPHERSNARTLDWLTLSMTAWQSQSRKRSSS